MSIEQNKTIVRQLIEEVFNQGDIALADTLVAPDFIEHEALPPGMPSGREGTKAATQMMHTAVSNFKAVINDMIAEGDKVAIHLTWSGIQTGEFMGMPPTGNSFSINVFDMFRIANGKIVEHWGLMDIMTMMQQLGAMDAPK